MSYENKMLQLKQKLGKKKEQQKEEKPTFRRPEKPFYIKEWESAGLTLVENDFGVLFKRVVTYPLDYLHGSYQLGLLYDAIEKWEQSSIQHPYAMNFDESIVFFDTETTGLKGVGTNIFLIGLLDALDDQFVLTQYVLADPANEASFLFESKFWQHSKTVVTYNGKSFDWPQLETRWTLNQQILPKLRSQKQIDLLHSSKRIWKNNLERMKLTKVEEEKLGFTRQGDIPGFLAPIIYSDAIKSGNADALMKVLHHNEWDLLSLVTLYIHSTNLLLEQELSESATTYTNIGKWFGDLKDSGQSEQVLTTVTNNYDDENTGLANYYLALQQKRNGQYAKAVNSFEKALLFIGNREKLKALEQLAIVFEHQFKDYEKALHYTNKGITLIDNNLFMKRDQAVKLRGVWLKRLQRLEMKLLKNKINL
ncbi:ribonuclease H-like domain-containing protein [Ureibacillus chungkukjangi]|uniref:ribonuclease H-like domain-containing protein n=1 Tax=Ureibacillus chungkukjangi TaxID=1202712 RepID=UPI00203F31E9|nr:ribonuclease H-like domain-containing protein [Ureibacillus chungkukjangi]MCM3389029.1 ribonuclease H-like domain-containing protein [Ureibacillus chungkukjangi]